MERSRQFLDDANEILSDLAYWVGLSDAEAAVRIAEGFGAALALSASLRARGSTSGAIVLALAERAHALTEGKDAQHAGWLLLSLKLELLEMKTPRAVALGEAREDLIRQLDHLTTELVQKGTAAMAGALTH